MRRVFVSGAFDEAGSRQLRFLHEASRLGPVTLQLWTDEMVAKTRAAPTHGSVPTIPTMGLAERVYYFEALSFVDKVEVASAGTGAAGFDPDRPEFWTADDGGSVAAGPDISGGAVWAVCEAVGGPTEAPNAAKRECCRSRGLELFEIPAKALAGFPYDPPPLSSVPASVPAPPSSSVPRAVPPGGRKRVVVTGCFDWLHSGHLRFFEEASQYGELNVVIGSDANVRLLKGEGHPLFPEAERRYMVGSFRAVARCLVSTGSGWLDAEPEIRALGIDCYVVNEEGDKGEKRRYCEANGIEYIVLKRVPKEGLPRRSSTDLRGY
jgi:cytidyltransferase-like protein